MKKAWMSLVLLGAGGFVQAQAPAAAPANAVPPGYGYMIVPVNCPNCTAPAASSYGPSGMLPPNLVPPYGPSPPSPFTVPQTSQVPIPPRKPFCDPCPPKCFNNSLDANTPNAFDMDCPPAHKHWFGF